VRAKNKLLGDPIKLKLPHSFKQVPGPLPDIGRCGAKKFVPRGDEKGSTFENARTGLVNTY
jgi:hypothetical protein